MYIESQQLCGSPCAGMSFKCLKIQMFQFRSIMCVAYWTYYACMLMFYSVLQCFTLTYYILEF